MRMRAFRLISQLLSRSDISSMASLLSLPDEVIDIIGIATERRLGIKTWCRLTSTCRHLRTMQLPQSRDGWAIPWDYQATIERMMHKLLSRTWQYWVTCYAA